jgi:hypothetical protein
MQDEDPKCPKCDGVMAKGHTKQVKEAGWHFWAPGEEKASWWALGVEQHASEGERRPITVYRCKKCGYLESYAN